MSLACAGSSSMNLVTKGLAKLTLRSLDLVPLLLVDPKLPNVDLFEESSFLLDLESYFEESMANLKYEQ